MTVIMGRMAAYSGKEIRWDQALSKMATAAACLAV